MHRSVRIALAALVVLAACSGGDEPAVATMTVDTLPGGTVVVRNTPPAEATHLLEEELRIGSADGTGATLFGVIKGIAVDDAGRIAVLESQAREVRIFGRDGAHLATYGKRGGGPGEFEEPIGIMRSSRGLLYVPDQRNTRMNVLDPDSGFVSTHPMLFRGITFLWEGAMRADDHVLQPTRSGEARREIVRISAPDMTPLDSVFMPNNPLVPTLPGGEVPGAFSWESADGRANGFAPIPFYPLGIRRLTSTGEFWSTANSDASYRIARWTPDGDTTLILQTEHAPIPVTAAERDSAMQASLSNSASSE